MRLIYLLSTLSFLLFFSSCSQEDRKFVPEEQSFISINDEYWDEVQNFGANDGNIEFYITSYYGFDESGTVKIKFLTYTEENELIGFDVAGTSTGDGFLPLGFVGDEEAADEVYLFDPEVMTVISSHTGDYFAESFRITLNLQEVQEYMTEYKEFYLGTPEPARRFAIQVLQEKQGSTTHNTIVFFDKE